MWEDGEPLCTGTLIAPGLIITAAHCLYENGILAGGGVPGGYRQQSHYLEFSPGSSYNGAFVVGDNPAAGSVYAPNYVWHIVNSWVPQCFADNNFQCDVGIAELEPASDGTYVGNSVGWWRTVANADGVFGMRFYLVGYPGSAAFGDYGYGYGNFQYVCDVDWEGEVWADDIYSSGVYNYSANGCLANGGSSGGPWFLLLADGSWAVNGVNSAGEKRPDGLSTNTTWNYLGDVYVGLYCYVVGGCARSARDHSTIGEMAKPIGGTRLRHPAAAGAG